jgi:hypothetical protein
VLGISSEICDSVRQEYLPKENGNRNRMGLCQEKEGYWKDKNIFIRGHKNNCEIELVRVHTYTRTHTNIYEKFILGIGSHDYGSLILHFAS